MGQPLVGTRGSARCDRESNLLSSWWRRTWPKVDPRACSLTGVRCSRATIYYPSRRQLAPAFGLLVNALRFKDEPRNRATRSVTRRRTG
jgi:hypothetical protein